MAAKTVRVDAVALKAAWKKAYDEWMDFDGPRDEEEYLRGKVDGYGNVLAMLKGFWETPAVRRLASRKKGKGKRRGKN